MISEIENIVAKLFECIVEDILWKNAEIVFSNANWNPLYDDDDDSALFVIVRFTHTLQ